MSDILKSKWRRVCIGYRLSRGVLRINDTQREVAVIRESASLSRLAIRRQ